MAAIGEEPMELEAMRKDDRSWHPGSISLSASRPATLAVEIHSKNFSEQYTIAGKDEVQSYLRYRSLPLQDGECANVEEGDQVLAMNKDKNKHLFLDAVVEKIRRVKHSKRVYCRCTFEVKWLHSESQLEETVLSSNLVMKLSKKSIDSHPVVVEFLNSVNSTQSTSDVSFLEESTPEIDILGVPEFDLQGLLEKQIEEISRFVDSSKENCVEEIIIGCSKVPNGDTTIAKVNRRRTLRSSTEEQKKKEPELEAKKKIEDSSFLTPLAARAALASLMHELPNSIKFSDHAEKEEAFANIPSSLNNMAATLNTDHSFQDFGAGRAACVSESKSSALNRQNLGRSLYQSEHKGAPDTKKSATRLTRSTAQKENPDTKNKTAGQFLDVGKKDNMRLTRSRIEKGSQDPAEEIQNHDKKKGAEMLTDELLTTKLVEKKDELFSVAPVKRETRNNQVIQKVKEHHSQIVPGNSEMESKQASASTFDGNIITKKGTKRTRLANAHENSIVNKEEIAVDDKSPQNPKQNGSCRKPGSRFSPRLRLLQSNGSGQ